jgi:hypothetical protein
VVLAAVIAAVVLLRAHPASVSDRAPPPITPSPTIDARSDLLTAAFHDVAQLPAGVHALGLVFYRYAAPEPGLDPTEYSATGELTVGGVDLDEMSVTVTRISGSRLDFGTCDPTSHDGSSCSEQRFPDGALAKVVRNAAFAQTAASDATTGVRPGIQTQLDAVYTDGTLLVVTLDADNGAGIPLDDADMLKLATIPGINERG